MAAGRKTGGRKKGTPNKTTRAAKDAIAFAAHELGGGERLLEWVREDKENERIFWQSIYTKLLPLEVNATGDLTIHLPNGAKSV